MSAKLSGEDLVPQECTPGGGCFQASRPCALAIHRCGARGQLLDLERGERVAHADWPQGVGIIRTVKCGVVALCASLPDGRRQIVSLATPEETISACAARGVPCWIEALTATTLCQVDLSSRARILHADCVLMDALLRASQQSLEAALGHMIALGRLDGTERVIAFLADMTHRLGRQDAGLWRVDLPLSREDIADYLGLNAETISRILGRIKRSGLAVFRSPTELVVPDLYALEARLPLTPCMPVRQDARGL